jgi:hypothetical protein
MKHSNYNVIVELPDTEKTALYNSRTNALAVLNSEEYSLFSKITSENEYSEKVASRLDKSPSGSACPYYFMGGELHPLKYGSYFENKEKLFAVIKAEEDFILKSSGQNNRRIWIDLYETKLTMRSLML